ncbi:MAG: S8 family serine peptidase [Gemmatimonadales bacterium]|nr:S8 family serine peptidase [Gemmatimonadales bacterium]
MRIPIRTVPLLPIVLLSLACHDSQTPTHLTEAPPALAASSTPGDRYIVTLRAEVADVPGVATAIVRSHQGVLHHTFVRTLHGFAADLPASEVGAVRAHPAVAALERDAIMSIRGTQSSATWGLDRLDQANLPLNQTYTWGPSGNGVRVYIIDTGIRTSHADFGGRATGGFTAITDGNGTADCNGHGTHVAGTVGGTTWGVAKQVALIGVRVLGCDGRGYTSGVIAGIEWVTTNAIKPAVANMSLGGGVSTSLDQAVQASINSGVTYVVSAGNDNADACGSSPARVPAAITVGASTAWDARSSFSNYGSCLDLFAPGSGITSAYATSDNATAVLSGTSMASPHAAGVAALYLETAPIASPAAVAAALSANSVTNAVTNIGALSPNRLLNTVFLSGSPQPGNLAPVAAFTWSCPTVTCQLDASSSTDDGTIVSYAWDLGRYPDPTATGISVAATYPHAGPRTVTLTVTDNGGKSTSITKTVNVGSPPPVDNPPVASFTWTCNYLSCTLNGGASSDDGSIQQYAWSMPGGTPGSAAGVTTTVSYPTAGSRSVTLTVTDNAGQAATLTRTVTVSAPPPSVDNPPVASFTWSCPTLTCQLDASSSTDDGTIVSYAWDLGRFPNPTATGVTVAATYPHTGSRTVTLTVTDNSGKSSSITKVLTLP